MTETPTPPSLAGPLLLWLGVQLIALGIGAAGVQLSAKSVRPVEALSIQVMLVTQIATAALLWPVLFRDWRTGAVVIATALPFVQAAGFLSATPDGRLLSAAGVLVLWLATLAILPSARAGAVGMAVLRAAVVLLSIGAAMLTYLRIEFAAAPTGAPVGPIVWSLREIAGKSDIFTWIYGAILFIVAALARVMIHRGRW